MDKSYKSYIEKEYRLAALSFKTAANADEQWEARKTMARLEAIASQCYGFEYADSLAPINELKPQPAGALGKINMCRLRNDVEDLQEDVKTLKMVYAFLKLNRDDLQEDEITSFRNLSENLHNAYMDFMQHVTNLKIQVDNCTTRWTEENED